MARTPFKLGMGEIPALVPIPDSVISNAATKVQQLNGANIFTINNCGSGEEMDNCQSCGGICGEKEGGSKLKNEDEMPAEDMENKEKPAPALKNGESNKDEGKGGEGDGDTDDEDMENRKPITYADVIASMRVSNAGTSDGVRKAWETRRSGHPLGTTKSGKSISHINSDLHRDNTITNSADIYERVAKYMNNATPLPADLQAELDAEIAKDFAA